MLLQEEGRRMDSKGFIGDKSKLLSVLQMQILTSNTEIIIFGGHFHLFCTSWCGHRKHINVNRSMNNGTEPNLGLPWWCPRRMLCLFVTQTGLWSLPLRLVTLDETGKSRLRQKSPLPQQWPAAMPVWGGGQYFTQEKSGTTWSEMRHVPNIKGVGVGHLILLSLIGLCVFFFFYLVLILWAWPGALLCFLLAFCSVRQCTLRSFHFSHDCGKANPIPWAFLLIYSVYLNSSNKKNCVMQF